TRRAGARLRPRNRLARGGALRIPQAPARRPGDRLSGLLPFRHRGDGPLRPGSSAMRFPMPALRRFLAGFVLACLALSPAMADAAKPAPDAIAKRISETVEAWTRSTNPYGRGFKVESVHTTPMAGMYEVRIVNDLFYVDEAARFIMIGGELIDMQSNQNITRDRLDEILAIDFAALPFDLALK